MTAHPSPAPRPARAPRVVVTALIGLGVVLLVGAAWIASRGLVTGGWFAYAPLSDTTYRPASVSSSGVAAMLAAAGALLVGGGVGFVVGRRSRPAGKPLG